MQRIERIKLAADDMVSAALTGDGWEAALTALCHAAGAQGAVLMRNRPGRMVAAVTTREVADAVADFAAGRSPPNSRYARVVTPPGKGFRIDHDDYSDEQLAVDPFYQEFLRPFGYFWHANVGLTSSSQEWIELSLKRHLRAGSYAREDAVEFDACLPALRAAARLAKHTLDTQTRGMAHVLSRRGPVFALDAWGRVIPDGECAGKDSDCPVRIVGRRLSVDDGPGRDALVRAVEQVLASRGHPALAALGGSNGHRWFVQVIPVPGRSRDLFQSAAALAVAIPDEGRPEAADLEAGIIRDAFGLTLREAEIAGSLSRGKSLAETAQSLRIEPGTARTHLKSVFEKTGVNRQAELVALLARLRP